MNLETLGWDAEWQEVFAAHAELGLVPARILVEHRGRFEVATNEGELFAEVAGRFRNRATMRSDLPAVGDFVALRLPAGDGPGTIEVVLPRRTAFIRKAAGEVTDDQVVAANIDIVLIVAALDKGFNLRQIERCLALAVVSGAKPVIVLSKTDLTPESDTFLAQVEEIAAGAQIFRISTRKREGLKPIEALVHTGVTIALLGPSGVGKSTLTNALLGRDIQKTQEVDASNGRGRHTTTGRHLFLRPGGGMLIDTPGMRELQQWYSDEGVAATFEDIETLATQCRFTSCRHETEPGCAVRAAIEKGDLTEERLANYTKLTDELKASESAAVMIARRRRKIGLKRQHS